MAAKPLKKLAAALALCLASTAVARAEPGRAAALRSVHVDEAVEGDVVVVAGDLSIGPNARVRGHAVAILGEVEVAPGAVVEGRVVAISSLASLTVDPLLEEQLPLLPVAVKVLNSGGWLLVTTVLAFLLPVRVRLGMRMLPEIGLRVVVLGAMAYLTLVAALVAALGLGPSLGVPLASAVFLVFFAAKAAGLAVIGGGLGSIVLGRVVHRPLPLTFAVFAGVAVLLACRFVPVVGGLVWTLVSVAALGASVLAMAVEPDHGPEPQTSPSPH